MAQIVGVGGTEMRRRAAGWMRERDAERVKGDMLDQGLVGRARIGAPTRERGKG
jgi:hypothetical protein